MGTLKVSFKSFQLNYPRISSHSLLIPSPNLLFRLSRSGCPAILNISSLKIGLDRNFRLSCSAFRRPTETRYFLYEYSRKGRRYLAQSTQQRSVQIIPTYPSQRKQYRELPSWPVEMEWGSLRSTERAEGYGRYFEQGELEFDNSWFTSRLLGS